MWPALADNSGYWLTGALASGTPVIAYDHPAAGELVHDGKNGRLVACDLIDEACRAPYVTADKISARRFTASIHEVLEN